MDHLNPAGGSFHSLPITMAKRFQPEEKRQIILPVDPLEEDGPDDPRVVLSHRQITRLVFVAAETGARFTRDRSPHDPAAWMSSPRHLFHGLNALNACVERDMFMRALVLHGVAPAYDMLPSEMDQLITADYGTDIAEKVPADAACDADLSAPLFPKLNKPALYVATLVDEKEGGICHVFFAAIADSEVSVREQLGRRLGAAAFHEAEVRLGFDPSEPVAMSAVSEIMAELLRQIEREPTSPLSSGFSFFVEHRFDD